MDRLVRLRKGREFDTVYREGVAVGSPLFVVRHLDNDGDFVRWGFAVGKRLAKEATTRNRLRRRLREAARRLCVATGHDIIITARRGALEASYSDLERGLERVIRRAGLSRSSE